MDLHAWITQQVDRAEEAVRTGLEGRRVAFQPNDGGPTITGAITGVTQTPEGSQFTIAQYDVEPMSTETTPIQPAIATLRRCEADRRILARHRLDPDVPWEPACKGCGTYSDMDLSTTDNVNECPELLDLAHAHGITNEILAGLDQPQPPEWKPRTDRRLGLVDILAARPITTSDVPEALRGPRWKP